MAWAVTSLQAVWWGTQPITEDGAVLFQRLFEVPPSSMQSAPGTSKATLSATQGSKNLVLQINGNRLDAFQAPLPAGPDLPTFPDVTNTVTEFSGWASTRRGPSELASRLAVVVQLHCLVDDAQNASRTFTENTDIDLPFNDGSDVIFQINRRKDLDGLEGSSINRLLKWSIEHIQTFSFGQGLPQMKTLHAVALGVDVNVFPRDDRTYGRDQQSQLFAAMGAEAIRLCEVRTLASLVN